MVCAQWPAPRSGRSSRSTDVTTTWRRPIFSAAAATLAGSSRSRSSPTLRERTAQYRQARVHVSPMIWNVAVPRPQHSPMFGQRASSQTVCRLPSRTISDELAEARPGGRCTHRHPGRPVFRDRAPGHQASAISMRRPSGSASPAYRFPASSSAISPRNAAPRRCELGVEAVEVVGLERQVDARLAHPAAPALALLGAAVDPDLEPVTTGDERVGTGLVDVHAEDVAVEGLRGLVLGREHRHAPPHATGTASNRRPSASPSCSQHDRLRLGARHLAARLALDRGDGEALVAARVEERERLQVARDVEGEAVRRDPARDVHADRRDLGARRRPDADVLRARAHLGRHAELGQGADQRRLQPLDVGPQVAAVVGQVEHRVADQLARAVVRGAAAAVGDGDGDAVRGQRRHARPRRRPRRPTRRASRPPGARTGSRCRAPRPASARRRARSSARPRRRTASARAGRTGTRHPAGDGGERVRSPRRCRRRSATSRGCASGRAGTARRRRRRRAGGRRSSAGTSSSGCRSRRCPARR